MYKYFLHKLSDWPLQNACNESLFGPDSEGFYLSTFDINTSTDHFVFRELSLSEAKQWILFLSQLEE